MRIRRAVTPIKPASYGITCRAFAPTFVVASPCRRLIATRPVIRKWPSLTRRTGIAITIGTWILFGLNGPFTSKFTFSQKPIRLPRSRRYAFGDGIRASRTAARRKITPPKKSITSFPRLCRTSKAIQNGKVPKYAWPAEIKSPFGI